MYKTTKMENGRLGIMENYIKEITKDLEPNWIQKVIECRDKTIEAGKAGPNFDKIAKGASWARLEDCLMVYAMVRYYKPHAILEIGTYIGTVTNVMMQAMFDNGSRTGIIYTIDKNNVYVPLEEYKGNVVYYNNISTKIVKRLKHNHVTIDFCFVDAGLKDDDARMIKKMMKNGVVFVTHDYKDGEKGVRNVEQMVKVCEDSKVYKPNMQGVGYDVGFGVNINSSVGVLIE